jgi:hypothetical protein
MEEISKLGWLIGFVKHAIWAEFLKTYDPPRRHVGLILFFLEDPRLNYVYAHGDVRLEVCLFRQFSFCHIHIHIHVLWTHCAVCCGSHFGLVFMSELLRVCLVLKIIQMSYLFPMPLNFSETPFTYAICKEPRGLSSSLE